MRITFYVLALLLLSLPATVWCGDADRQAALDLVRDYFKFIEAGHLTDSEYRAGEKFAYPSADYNYLGPGSDSLEYLIVKKSYKVVQVQPVKKEDYEDPPKVLDTIMVKVRFEGLGLLDLYKDKFQPRRGPVDVTFYCAKYKGKAMIVDMDNIHLRFLDTALFFLEDKSKTVSHLNPRYAHLLKSLKSAIH